MSAARSGTHGRGKRSNGMAMQLQLHNPNSVLPRITDGISIEEGLKEFKLLLKDSMKSTTKDTYQSEIRAYVKWCQAPQADGWAQNPFPVQPELVAAYVGAMTKAGRKPNGINTALTALRVVNSLYFKDAPDPVTRHVRLALEKYKRDNPRKTATRRAKPLAWDDVLLLIRECDNSLLGTRDKAIFATMYMNALRVTECSTIDREDLEPVENWQSGYVLHIPVHKTVQHAGAGYTQTATKADWGTECPVFLLRDWLEKADAAWAQTHQSWANRVTKDLRKASESAVAEKYRELLSRVFKKNETSRSLASKIKQALKPNSGAGGHQLAELILEVEKRAAFVGVNRHGQVTGRRLDARSFNRTLQKVGKRLIERGDWEPETLATISSHSFRRGIATESVERGEDLWKISMHLRHSSESTTRTYIDEANVFTGGLGGALV
jgi:integrase